MVPGNPVVPEIRFPESSKMRQPGTLYEIRIVAPIPFMLGTITSLKLRQAPTRGPY
jgi:hypothetical protein